MQTSSSLLPPKKRQQAAQQVTPLEASAAEAKPKPAEGDSGVSKSSSSSSGQPSIDPTIASVVEVETSKIRGSAPPRKPRVGEQYQAELPELLEQPVRLQKG